MVKEELFFCVVYVFSPPGGCKFLAINSLFNNRISVICKTYQNLKGKIKNSREIYSYFFDSAFLLFLLTRRAI